MQENNYQIESDSIVSSTIIKDTLQASSPDTSASQRIDESGSEPILIESIPSILPKKIIQKETEVLKIIQAVNIQKEVVELQTNKTTEHSDNNSQRDTIDRFSFYSRSENLLDKKPQTIWKEGYSKENDADNLLFLPKKTGNTEFNWALFVGFTSICLLLILKIYYQKFVSKVVNTMVNFQLEDNMLREKNIIVRRAFFIMNLNFIFVFSLFILLMARLYNISYSGSTFLDYLLILGIVLIVMLTRLLVLYFVGFLFEWMPAISAHIHNSYLINKNLGLLLLPIVFSAIFATPEFSKVLIYIGLVLFLLASLFKLIRGFQIIIRNGILLFYAIVYLCTLELLPLVLGVKAIILLR